MPIHQQVYLDEAAEQALQQVMHLTGLSMSETLKNGLVLLQQQMNIKPPPVAKPFDIYQQLELGEGGDHG